MNLTKINRLSSPENKGTGLEMYFNNGELISISNDTLRKNCPCASCLEKRGNSNHSTPLTPKTGRSLLKVISATSEEELNLEKIWILGNYALGMKWGDGHDTGIYTFEYLTSLAKN